MTNQGLQGGATGQQDRQFPEIDGAGSTTVLAAVELTAGGTHTFTVEQFNYLPTVSSGTAVPWTELRITSLPSTGMLLLRGEAVVLERPQGAPSHVPAVKTLMPDDLQHLTYMAPSSVPADPAVTFMFTFDNGTHTASGTFTFNLTVPDFSFTDTSVTAFSLGENIDASGQDAAITIGTVGTANSSGTVTYALDMAATDAGFAIDGTSGAITYTGTGLDHEAAALRTLTVTATDTPQSGNPVMVTHKVVVAVTDVAESPVFTSGATGMTLPENTEVAADAVVYTAAATDDEGAMITYALKADNSDDAALFEIDGTTGAVTFKAATLPDFETKDSYTFTVIARDGDAGTDDTEQMVTLSVGDVTDATIALNNLTLLMEDDTDTATRIKVADIDLMDDTEGRMDPVTLEVVQDASTAASMSFADPSVATNPPTLTVTAVKGGTAGNNITITVMADATLPRNVGATDAYENIAFDITETDGVTAIVVRYSTADGRFQEIVEAANADARVANLVTFARSNDDGTGNAFAVATTNLTGGVDMTKPSDFFEVDGGALYLKADADLNAHANPELTVRVQVAEYKHVGAEYTLIVTGDPITFTDATGVDKAVKLDLDNETPQDDLNAGGTLEITNAGDSPTITSNASSAARYGTFAYDNATGVWTYELKRDDPETAALITNATEGSTIEETLTVTVTPSAGPAVTHDIVVTLTVEKTAAVDNAPVIDSAAPTAGMAAIAENHDGSGTAVDVATVTAMDEDPGDTVTYAIDAASTALGFVIDSSGVITYTGNGSALDFEAITDADTGTDGAQHVITVTATGGGKGSATHDVTVTITDVNEPVSIASPALVTAIEEGTPIGMDVVLYTAMAMDDAGDVVTFTLEGLDAELFSIDATTGAVTFKAMTTPTFATKSYYDFVVVATSNDPVEVGAEARQAVRVPVLQTANAPTVIEEATNASFTLYGVEFIAKGIGASALKFIIEASGNSGADASAITVGEENMTPDENTYTFALKSVVSSSDPTAATISQAELVTLWNADDARKSAVLARIVEPRADVDVGTLLEQYGGETHGFSAAAVPDNYKLILVNAMVSGSPSQHESYGASGILNISDDNGVLLVTHNKDALKWGDFTINAETGVWSYTIPTANIQPLRVLLGDGALPEGETITISAIDSNGIETTYDLVIEFRESGQDEIFEAGSISIATIAENADGSGTAIAIGTVDAGDILDTGTIYSLDAASVALGFAIDDGTGAITYTGSGLDHEATPTITLTVTAAGKIIDTADNSETPHPTRKVTHEVTVFVEDVNEAPTFPANVSAIVSTATTIKLADYFDDPEGATFTFSDVKVNDGSQDGANLPDGITYANGVLTVAASVTTAATHMLRFKATSSDGNETEHTFTLNIQTAVPVFTSGASGGTVTGTQATTTIHGVVFTAVTPGPAGNALVLKVVTTPTNHGVIATSQGNGYSITVNRGGGSTLTPREFLAIWNGDGTPDRLNDITAILDPSGTPDPDTGITKSQFNNLTKPLSGGTVTSYNALAENTAVAATAGVYYAAATDADSGDTITYSLKAGVGDEALFAINGTSGAVTFKAATTPDFETKASYAFTVIASDGKGGSAEQAVTIAVANRADAPMIDSAAPTTGKFFENVDGRETPYIIRTGEDNTPLIITATDADVGDTITYTLSGTGSDQFAISSTGAITYVGDGIDFEDASATKEFTLTVTARDTSINDMDGGRRNDTHMVTINVLNVDETPQISGGARVADTVTAGTEVTTTTAVYTASLVASTVDADQTHLWSLKHGEGDAELFEISNADGTEGEVTFKDATTPNATMKGTYTFTVVVTDGVNEGQEQVVYLQVDDGTNGAPPIVLDLPNQTVTDTALRDELVLAEGDFSDYVRDPDSGRDDDSTALRYAVSIVASDGMATTPGDVLTQPQMDATYPFPFTVEGAALYTHSVAYDNGNFFYNERNGDWIFHVNEAYLDALAAEETLTFSLQVTDAATTADPDATDANPPAAKTFTIKLVPTAEAETTTYSGDYLVPIAYVSNDASESYAANETAPTVAVAGHIFSGVLTTTLTDISADLADVTLGEIVQRLTVHELVSQTAATDDAPATFTYKTAPHGNLTNGRYTLVDGDAGKQFVFEHSWHYGGKTYKFITEPTLAVADADDPTFDDAEPLTATIAENADGSTTAVTPLESDGTTALAVVATHSSDPITYDLDAASKELGFAISNAGAITYTGDGANLDFEGMGTITLTVTATTANGMATREVVVTITDADDTPAFADDAPTTGRIFENMAGSDTPIVVVTGEDATPLIVTATDEDAADSVTYALDAAAVTAGFAIDAMTGAITYTGAAIDFEDAAAVKEFTLTITATSSNAESTPAATHMVTINVINIDEHAPVFDAASVVTHTMDENTDASGTGDAIMIGTVTATDADAANNADVSVTYSLDKASTDAGFAIDSAGALTYAGDGSGLDFEAGAAHVVKVTAKDSSSETGGMTATHNVVVFLTDVDEPPVFAANTPTTASIAENADGSDEAIAIATVMATDLDASGGDVTYALDMAATDAGFAIDAMSGAITYEGTGLDHEAAGTITLTVTATSTNGGGRDHEIVVTVTDVNEAPVFESLGSAQPTITIGADGSTDAIDVIAVTAEDPEGDDIQYGLDAASVALGFVVDGTGQITYTGTGIDTAQTITLTVVARDADEYNTLEVPVMVASSLAFADGTPTTIDLPEDTDGTTQAVLLETFVAEDDDMNTVTYAITAGNDDSLFALDAARGILTYSGGPIDFEGAGTKEFTLTITATAGGHTIEHMVTIAVSDVNEHAPTTTPATLDAIAEGATYTFKETDFGFMDEDGSGALASVTITKLPELGRLVVDGRGPVAEGGTIAVADIGKLLYRSGNDFATNTDVTFTYTVSDGQKNSAEATMTIMVTATNNDPISEVDNDIAFNTGDAFVFTRRQLDSSDSDSPDVPLTYTLKAAITDGGGAVLEARATSADAWVALAANGTFTQAQVDAGNVRLSGATEGGSFELTVPEGGDETINFLVRVEEEAMGTELGGTDLDRSTETAPRTIEAGVGDTTITPGSGDDEIDPGLGDDVVDLTAGGDDIVIYRYATDDDGNPTIAWGGGDRITGFTPGKDQLHLADVSGASGDFLAGLGSGFIVTLSTAYDSVANEDRSQIASYDVTGIEFHFSQAVVLPGGVLGGSILSIEFAGNPIPWADFSRDWLNDGAAFSSGSLTFRNDNEGKAALMRILGLDDAGADALRSVAIGDDAVNAIDLGTASEAGDEWVVFGGGGDDGITLGAGTEQVVYRLAVDDSNVITAPDGGDTVTGFTLGTDSLTFVDTDDATVVSLDDLLGAFDSVSLVYNMTDSTYTGIVFGVVADDAGTNDTDESVNLTVSFATALNAGALADALGTTIADAAALGTIFEGGNVPTGDGPAALNAAGIALIDDLFGADNISVDDSLPVELL